MTAADQLAQALVYASICDKALLRGAEDDVLHTTQNWLTEREMDDDIKKDALARKSLEIVHAARKHESLSSLQKLAKQWLPDTDASSIVAQLKKVKNVPLSDVQQTQRSTYAIVDALYNKGSSSSVVSTEATEYAQSHHYHQEGLMPADGLWDRIKSFLGSSESRRMQTILRAIEEAKEKVVARAKASVGTALGDNALENATKQLIAYEGDFLFVPFKSASFWKISSNPKISMRKRDALNESAKEIGKLLDSLSVSEELKNVRDALNRLKGIANQLAALHYDIGTGTTSRVPKKELDELRQDFNTLFAFWNKTSAEDLARGATSAAVTDTNQVWQLDSSSRSESTQKTASLEFDMDDQWERLPASPPKQAAAAAASSSVFDMGSMWETVSNYEDEMTREKEQLTATLIPTTAMEAAAAVVADETVKLDMPDQAPPPSTDLLSYLDDE